MAGMSRMDRREPQFLEARGEMTSAYDWLATGGRRTHSQEVIHFDPRSQITVTWNKSVTSPQFLYKVKSALSVYFHLACVLKSPGEFLKLHMSRPHTIPIKSASLG